MQSPQTGFQVDLGDLGAHFQLLVYPDSLEHQVGQDFLREDGADVFQVEFQLSSKFQEVCHEPEEVRSIDLDVYVGEELGVEVLH